MFKLIQILSLSCCLLGVASLYADRGGGGGRGGRGGGDRFDGDHNARGRNDWHGDHYNNNWHGGDYDHHYGWHDGYGWYGGYSSNIYINPGYGGGFSGGGDYETYPYYYEQPGLQMELN